MSPLDLLDLDLVLVRDLDLLLRLLDLERSRLKPDPDLDLVGNIVMGLILKVESECLKHISLTLISCYIYPLILFHIFTNPNT